MQELLGRLSALDPEASQGLRVIACFDELMSGGVAVRGLLNAAAALAGVPVGMQRGGEVQRVDARGALLSTTPPPRRLSAEAGAGVDVWIERERPLANDAIVLERLALSVRLRLDPRGPASASEAVRRDVAALLDPTTSPAARGEAAARLRLSGGERYRVLVAPLFAVWRQHPSGPEDVVWTSHGPVHVVLVQQAATAAGAPLGLGVAASLEQLPRSYRTALIALRLHDGSAVDPVCADDLGGLAELLAELSDDDGADVDGPGMAGVMSHGWGYATVDALVRSSTVREAAREVGVHHSTMTSRVEVITGLLGFDPLTGLGRTRLGIGFLRWRLRHSRVLQLPPPAESH